MILGNGNGNELMKAPSANNQAPNKLQAPSANGLILLAHGFGVWSLEILWNLKPGIWNF
jgi:hypothetical protein